MAIGVVSSADDRWQDSVTPDHKPADSVTPDGTKRCHQSPEKCATQMPPKSGKQDHQVAIRYLGQESTDQWSGVFTWQLKDIRGVVWTLKIKSAMIVWLSRRWTEDISNGTTQCIGQWLKELVVRLWSPLSVTLLKYQWALFVNWPQWRLQLYQPARRDHNLQSYWDLLKRVERKVGVETL